MQPEKHYYYIIPSLLFLLRSVTTEKYFLLTDRPSLYFTNRKEATAQDEKEGRAIYYFT